MRKESLYQQLHRNAHSRAIGALITATLITACAGGGDSSAPGTSLRISKQAMTLRAKDWQTRQAAEQWPRGVVIKLPPEPVSLYDDVEYMIQRLPYVERASDQEVHGVEDYWQTTGETDELGTGDCEDMAGRAMVAIMLSGLLERYGATVAVRVLDYPDQVNAPGHAVCTVEGPGGEIVEISNMTVRNWEDDGHEVMSFDLERIYG